MPFRAGMKSLDKCYEYFDHKLAAQTQAGMKSLDKCYEYFDHKLAAQTKGVTSMKKGRQLPPRYWPD